MTKLTFYRHFPSKNDLILAYLNLRHEQWMGWFTTALERHGGAAQGAQVLAPVMEEWFRGRALGDFRGCAFLNGVSEMGPAMPAVIDLTRQHKQEMTDAIEALLPPSGQRRLAAEALACAVDGAIVQAQYSVDLAPALRGLPQRPRSHNQGPPGRALTGALLAARTFGLVVLGNGDASLEDALRLYPNHEAAATAKERLALLRS